MLQQSHCRAPCSVPGWRPAPAAVTAAVFAVRCGSTKQSQTYELLQERGVEFTPGSAFYRAESAQGRDLAVLAAAVYRRQHGQLRVLDVMSGSGMRGARYIQQAGADLVWCNDYDRRNNTALVYNLVNALQHNSNGQPGSDSSSSSSSSREGHVEACVQQWSAEAYAFKYEGIRGDVLQWQRQVDTREQQQQIQQQQQQQQQPALLQEQVQSHAQQEQQRRQQQQQLESVYHQGLQEGQPAQHHQQQQHPQISQQVEPQAVTQLEQQAHHDETQPPPLQQQQQQQQQQRQQQCVRLTHVDAQRLLASVYLQEDYFDLVDVDSFGSDTSYLAAAVDALKYGGLLYLTSTDGMSAGGKRPQRSLAAYGAYLRSIPSANEQGLRMLIGAAVREGAARGVSLTPMFSLYSYHGPVFRVMLRASRSNEALNLRHYSYVGHCYVHGESYRVGWRGLSQAWCRCKHHTDAAADSKTGDGAADHHPTRPTPLVLSGPMWTGPLHDTGFVQCMSELAAEWGWSGSAVPANSPYVARQSKNNRQRRLEDLLQLLEEESAPELPPWFTCINTLAQHLSTTPSRDKLVAALQARGYTACCCHVEQRALRTNATTAEVLQVAVEDCRYSLRPDDQPGVPAVLLQRQQVEDLQQLENVFGTSSGTGSDGVILNSSWQ